MNLSDRERESDLWRKLSAHLEGLLEAQRSDLEKTTNTELQTAALRGRVKLIRQLLKLGNVPINPSAPVTETEYR
jgi:hypothetical protein